MNNWEPSNWKSPIKILVGLATVWPPIYIVLFILLMFSFMAIIPFVIDKTADNTQEISLLELYRKIDKGEIKELAISEREAIAIDRNSGIRYRTFLTESTRREILTAAGQKDESGQPRVAKVEENSTPTPAGLPFAIVGVFFAHFITIMLMLLLMPFYIVLAVKNDRIDQTTRIIWIVLLCTLTIFAAPVYWFLYIWRKPSPVMPAAVLSAS